MYNEHFGFAQSPFNFTPDPRFFFVNPCYEEAVATLRYGIGRRKGVIVVTGEAGTGKTALLKRLLQGLESNVRSVCIFDPHLSFAELLRCTLNELGITNAAEDRLTMMSQFYDYLIRQFECGQIVSLMIDEAQNLSEEMLEEIRLLSNLETDTEKLIQIVLVGQPEFEDKLGQAQLLELQQRVTLRCRLRPLEKYEVGSYINSRLNTVRCKRQELFDSESIERIARYSKGIPRLVNIICDNAMLIAYANSASRVSVKEIDEVARELKLLDEPRIAPRTHAGILENMARAPLDGEYHLGSNRTARAASRGEPSPAEFDPLFMEVGQRPSGWRKPNRSHPHRLGVLLILLITLYTVLIFNVRQSQLSFSDVTTYVNRLTAFGREDDNAVPVTPPPAAQSQSIGDSPTRMKSTLENLPRSENRSSDKLDPHRDATQYSEPVAIPLNGKETTVSRESAESAIKKRPVFKGQPAGRSMDDEAIARRKLEFEIYRAIHNRAIRSVEVSVIDGMVYLEGRVATPRQKIAAVRATLSVPGVKDIRDRIIVDG